MLEGLFRSARLVARLRCGVTGPYVAGFGEWLRRAHYAAGTTRGYLIAVGHLGRWATDRGLAVAALGDATEDFGRHLSACRCRDYRPREERRRTLGRVRSFVSYLQLLGVVPPAPTATGAAKGTDHPLLEGFSRWMTQNRGVRPATLRGYRTTLPVFLRALGEEPSTFEAREIRQFIADYCGRRRPSTGASLVSKVRMFLRYLASQGWCSPTLAESIPSPARWRLQELPHYLAPEQVECAIDRCAQGRHPLRDRAILVLLNRLALRAGDVRGLQLADIDWQGGTVRVAGKGRCQVALPLTQEIGDALADYFMHERPPTAAGHVFVRGEAPFGPLAGGTISLIVRAALTRAGVRSRTMRAHVLRHSSATALLSRGFALDEIATLLRHRSVETTMVYAKVDVRALAEIAQPWPQGSSC